MKPTAGKTVKELQISKRVLKVLLVCGILSSLLYIGTDILASLLYEGYSYTSQQVSELSAVGAPTRQLWITMSFVWAPLVFAFGTGVFLLSGLKRALRLAGILIAVYAVVGLLWNFAPMHQRGTVELEGDIMHIVFAGVQVLLLLLFISFGSGAGGKGFRIYSIVTIIALLLFGGLTGTQASAIAEGQPTPWMGIIERVNVYMSMVWVLVFAAVLLRTERDTVRIQTE
jgi:hypothetical protein